MKNLLHKPVLINEVISSLNVRDELYYVDATFGFGGYTKGILKKAKCKVISMDQDPAVRPFARNLKKEYTNRFDFFLTKFSNLKDVIEKKGLKIISGGVVADLGLSSMQINNSKRGFSFMRDGPLDMTMSQTGKSAEKVINTFKEKELSDIFWKYGEEKKSRQVAKKIVKERKEKAISSTFELVEIIKKVIKKNNSKIHPATKVFQALRIFVNNELFELEKLISNAEKLLLPGARIAIVSFHSLEDRIVKFSFNKLSGKTSNLNRHLPTKTVKSQIKFKTVYKKIIRPRNDEILENKKARSARLRVLERKKI